MWQQGLSGPQSIAWLLCAWIEGHLLQGLSSCVHTPLQVHERLAREKARGDETEMTEELESSFRLLLLLNSLDLKLLHSSIKEMGK